MRQLLISVPRGRGDRVLEMAKRHDGVNMVRLEGQGADGPLDLVMVYVPNDQVERLMGDMEQLEQAHSTLAPRGMLTLSPPEGEVGRQLRDVKMLSPIEVYLSGLQSIGSWKGFMGYAFASAVVVWIGLFTNTIYLLTAAMLLAPFAGPAMNLAIGTARGDAELIRRNVLRYFTALALAVVVAWALTLLFRMEIATAQMIRASEISTAAFLLPVIAGAAGAMHLFQSERNSLVSGAAIGLLVAASLAPPTGMIGMAIAIGRWDLVSNGIFVLLLQLVGINLSAALLFRWLGLGPKGARYDRGKRWLEWASLAVTAVGLAGLLAWQFSNSPELQRSTQAQRAAAAISEVTSGYEAAYLVEQDVRFTRQNVPGKETLLATLYVQRNPESGVSDEQIRQTLTRAVQGRLLAMPMTVTPLVQVNVLSPP